MGRQWQFTQDEQLQWRWTRTDTEETPIQSETTFPDQARCMLDAVRFAVERRRASAPLEEPANDGGAQPH